jgi:hypothetical protein
MELLLHAFLSLTFPQLLTQAKKTARLPNCDCQSIKTL